MRHSPLGRTGVAVAALLLVLATSGLVACSDQTSSTTTTTTAIGSTAPVLADPSATGRELATRFMTILQQQDGAALSAFLADGFVIQRADGSTATRDQYLASPISVSSFELGPDVLGVQDGDVLVVRWSVAASEATGAGAYGRTEAPRLSTFVWRDGAWRMVSHANFNAADRVTLRPDPRDGPLTSAAAGPWR